MHGTQLCIMLLSMHQPSPMPQAAHPLDIGAIFANNFIKIKVEIIKTMEQNKVEFFLEFLSFLKHIIDIQVCY